MNISEPKISEAIGFIKESLKEIYHETEIQSFIWIIFEKLMNFSKTDLHLAQDTKLSHSVISEIEKITGRLKKQEPIQYILGETEFYDLKFNVNPAVLIPRPETEELVHWIINDQPGFKGSILDIGTGSGCIPVSLAKNIPDATVFAIDISEEALNTAAQNASLNEVTVYFMQMDILAGQNSSLDNKLDIIVSNPPYVRDSEKKMMQDNVLDHEPHLALFVPDNEALKFYDAIASFAIGNLKPKGFLYLEINEYLSAETAVLLESRNFVNIEIRKDINGRARMIKAQLDSIW